MCRFTKTERLTQEVIPLDRETEKTLEEKTIRAFMDGDFSGILRVDGEGMIAEINDRARALLDCRHRDVDGMYVCDLFPLLEEELLNDVIRQGDSVANWYVQSRVARFAVNMEPVGDRDGPDGAVIFLQRLPIPPRSGGEKQEYSVTSNRFFSEFQTASGAFLRAIKLLKYTAQQDHPILLVGEDGTEIPALAKCIHNESGRRKNGYAEVECDALSAEQVSHLLFDRAPESESSGLNRSIASIQGGTLFLSHIDRLSPDLQYRIGLLIRGVYVAENELHQRPADIRVIASTDRDLKELIRQALFREDLYYALSPTTVTVPPLRERGDEIIDIAIHFLGIYREKYDKPVKLTRGAYDCLREYSWPGNTRELDAFCRKIVLTTPRHSVNEAFIRSALEEMKGTAGPADAAAPETAGTDDPAAKIREALRRNGGSKMRTAAELGISKATLWRRMQKYGIRDDSGGSDKRV